MKKKNIIISIVLTLISVIFGVLITKVDVQNVGLEGTDLGFATLNKNVFDTLGTNNIWNTITDIFLGLTIFILALYALKGLVQLIKRKNLWKVDRELLYFGGIFIIVFIMYIFFIKVPINYRPVLENGALESSFPSTHVMVITTILGMGYFLNKEKYKKLAKYTNIIFPVIIILAIVGKILSGKHWITDIIESLLISITLVYIYRSLLKGIRKN